jgi:hypothetical protein
MFNIGSKYVALVITMKIKSGRITLVMFGQHRDIQKRKKRFKTLN